MPINDYTITVNVKNVSGNVWVGNLLHSNGNISWGNRTTFLLKTGINVFTFSGEVAGLYFQASATANIELHWVKLELGKSSTPFVLGLHNREVALCQRYYKILHRIPIFALNTTRVTYFSPAVFGIPLRDAPQVTVIEILNSNADVPTGVTMTGSTIYKQNISNIVLSKNIGDVGYISLHLDAEIY
jgi:hypothetical protein